MARTYPGRRMIDDPTGAVGSGTAEDPRLVVEAWLAVPAGEEWRVLMLRRRPDQGGFWLGVSGRVETCDVSLRAAALREIREETGLDGGIAILDLGLWLTFRGFSGVHFRKRSLGAILPSGTSPEAIVLSDEHEEAVLVTFEEATARVRWRENVRELAALRAALAAR